MSQLPYGGLDRDKPLIRIPFTYFSVATVSLALIGLITCISISITYHFEESIYTHCQVPNYLPSISASISLLPERYVWRLCIGLHSAPRFLVAVVYFSFYRQRVAHSLLEQLFSVLVLVTSFSENIGLLLLTYVSSTETYSVHKNGFVVFIGSSLVHMLLTCRLWHVMKKSFYSTEESRSYHWKLRLFFFNVTFCLLAAYFFRRHNKHCEPGIYTFFALCEYLVVLSNMAFHMTAFWDFNGKVVMVTTLPEDKRV